jgi:transcriptional regulator with PAS, ATPase and Fis domain
LNRYSQETNKLVDGIQRAAMDEMMLYDWPGNVRELENAIERAIVIGKQRKIRSEDLPFYCPQAVAMPPDDSLKEVEKFHIQRVLDQNDWNIARCAKILGIDRTTLYSKIKRYRLRKSD